MNIMEYMHGQNSLKAWKCVPKCATKFCHVHYSARLLHDGVSWPSRLFCKSELAFPVKIMPKRRLWIVLENANELCRSSVTKNMFWVRDCCQMNLENRN